MSSLCTIEATGAEARNDGTGDIGTISHMFSQIILLDLEHLPSDCLHHFRDIDPPKQSLIVLCPRPNPSPQTRGWSNSRAGRKFALYVPTQDWSLVPGTPYGPPSLPGITSELRIRSNLWAMPSVAQNTQAHTHTHSYFNVDPHMITHCFINCIKGTIFQPVIE